MNIISKSVFHCAILLSVVLAAPAATTACQSDDTSPITHVPDASSDHTMPSSEAGADAAHDDAGVPEGATDSEATDASPDVRDGAAD
jgi:ABC-type sugar transport system substrate-binding protein